MEYAVRYVPIDIPMKVRTIIKKLPGEGNRTTSETLLAPTDAKAWLRAVDLLDSFKDEDLDLGSIYTWSPNDVLVLDSFSTLAKCAYYFSQSMNARLGARERRAGLPTRCRRSTISINKNIRNYFSSIVQCNIIVISHITWVDESQGVASRPQEVTGDKDFVSSNPDGYPSAIGRALSPHMGKYFNDAYIARSSGTGSSVRRTISTVPQDGVLAKNSVYLDREYPVETGLAEIFAALRNQPVPQDLLDAYKRKPLASSQPISLGQKSSTSAVA